MASKVLYIANVIGQLFLLNTVLATEYSIYGFDVSIVRFYAPFSHRHTVQMYEPQFHKGGGTGHTKACKPGGNRSWSAARPSPL